MKIKRKVLISNSKMLRKRCGQDCVARTADKSSVMVWWTSGFGLGGPGSSPGNGIILFTSLIKR